MVYLQPTSAERLGQLDNINRTKIDARRTPVLRYLLKADHVIVAVNPHQMNKITFEPDRGLKFHCGKKETSISRDGDDFFIRAPQTSGDAPRQRDPQGLLSISHEYLAWAEAIEMSRQPDMKRS